VAPAVGDSDPASSSRQAADIRSISPRDRPISNIFSILGGCPDNLASVGPVAHLIGAEAVHLEYPTQVVFESISLGVNDGARIGIVGRNGDGKSSLLRLLTGQLRPDSAASPSAADCGSAR